MKHVYRIFRFIASLFCTLRTFAAISAAVESIDRALEGSRGIQRSENAVRVTVYEEMYGTVFEAPVNVICSRNQLHVREQK